MIVHAVECNARNQYERKVDVVAVVRRFEKCRKGSSYIDGGRAELPRRTGGQGTLPTGYLFRENQVPSRIIPYFGSMVFEH